MFSPFLSDFAAIQFRHVETILYGSKIPYLMKMNNKNRAASESFFYNLSPLQ